VLHAVTPRSDSFAGPRLSEEVGCNRSERQRGHRQLLHAVTPRSESCAGPRFSSERHGGDPVAAGVCPVPLCTKLAGWWKQAAFARSPGVVSHALCCEQVVPSGRRRQPCPWLTGPSASPDARTASAGKVA
jgi:hypothetical protein